MVRAAEKNLQQYKMKIATIILTLFLAGCSTTSNYQTYVETQKALNRDYTAAELARIAALTEIVKDSQDSKVRIQAIRALQEIQRTKKPLEIQQSKGIFGF